MNAPACDGGSAPTRPVHLIRCSGSEREGDAVDRLLGFLEIAGCFLLWVTYFVILRAVAHAKRPGPAKAPERDGSPTLNVRIAAAARSR